jgi:hypothetical protein
MSEALQSVQTAELSGVDFGNFRNPEVALREAELVAQAFAKRAEKLQLYKTIGASKHLLIEGWQMLASMYRVTASITSTKYLEFGGVTGWEATAEAIYIPTGQVVSRADAMCLSDEDNWGPRPKYEWREENGKRVKTLIGTVPTPTQQLRSMAQTRSCSKVYANLLKFVARMAGFAGTPAEEMTGNESGTHGDNGGQHQPSGNGGGGPQRAQTGPVISEAQAKRLFAIGKQSGRTPDQQKAILQHFGFSDDREITKDKYEAICSAMQNPQWAPPSGAASQPAAAATGAPAATGTAATSADMWAEVVRAYGGEVKAIQALSQQMGFENWSQVNASDRASLAMRLIQAVKQ